MRVVKFRAISIENKPELGIKIGDFVYGDFAQFGRATISWYIKQNPHLTVKLECKVKIETLGQYIGITLNNVEIYEGDLIADQYDNKYEVTFSDVSGAWELHGDNMHEQIPAYDINPKSNTLIGNIHQVLNPKNHKYLGG